MYVYIYIYIYIIYTYKIGSVSSLHPVAPSVENMRIWGGVI